MRLQCAVLQAKEWPDYQKLISTTKFFNALSADLGQHQDELVISTQGIEGEDRRNQGTWGHPQIAIDLAQWLSPEFKVKVTKWVFEWMSGLNAPMATPKPSFDFMNRYHLNANRVDHDFFSIIGELYVRIHGALEHEGYVLPERAPDGKLLRPDISVGQTFPKWLAENYPGLADKRKKYSHLLPDNMEVDAWQYHNSVWPQFMKFMQQIWLPERAVSYFKSRDPKAIPFVEKMVACLPAPQATKALPQK